jgi:FkbM family methyltransferase
MNSDPLKDAFQTQLRLIKEARIVFDVGANKGQVTDRYAAMFPGAEIHAFEPFPDFKEEFLSRHGSNNMINWVNKALSERVGTTDYYINKNTDTNSLLKSVLIGAASDKSCRNVSSFQVQTETIDHYCTMHTIDAIDILKLDTQGSELAILKGAKKMLEEKKIALIYAEAFFQPQYENSPLLYDIANYLKEFGYFLEDIYEPYYNERFLLWCDAIFIPKKK